MPDTNTISTVATTTIPVTQIIGYIVSGFLALISIIVGVFVRREMKKDALLREEKENSEKEFRDYLKEQIKLLWKRVDQSTEDRRNICLKLAELKGAHDTFYQEHKTTISRGIHKG